MYVKLVPIRQSGYTQSAHMMETLKGIMDGSVASTADLSDTFFDVGSCVMSGTAPTAGTYHTFDMDSGTGNSPGNYLTCKKKHSQHESSWDAQVTIDFRWSTGFFGRMMDANGANPFPSSNANTIWGNGQTKGSGYGFGASYCQWSSGTNYIHEWHIIISDSTFMLHQINFTNAGTLESYGNATTIYSDLDKIDVLDENALSENSAYCPTTYMHVVSPATLKDNFSSYDYQTSAQYNEMAFWIGRQQFKDATGAFQNHTNPSSNALLYSSTVTEMPMFSPNYGTTGSNSNWNASSIFPAPSAAMKYPTELVGDANDILVPVQRFPNAAALGEGNGSGETYDSRFGSYRDMYRTTDDSVLNGQEITVSGNTYRAFRIHKTASKTNNSYQMSKNTACYVFPED
jgi:hypothetical protein